MAKKILIYTNHFFPENFKINEIAEIFSENGHEVLVVTGLPNYPTGKLFEGYGLFKRNHERLNQNLSVRRLPLITRGGGSKFRIILNYITYFISTFIYTIGLGLFYKKYDIVFVHHTSPVFITLSPIFYKWLRRSELVLWDLDMWPDTLVAVGIVKSKNVAEFLEKGMHWVYSKYDRILLGSNGFFEKASNRVKGNRLEYFPNWAEKIFTDPVASVQESIVDFPDSFTLTYAGNVGEAQDFENIFEAMLLLQNFSISWVIIGDGRYRSKLQEKVHQCGLDSKVKFMGNHPLEKMPEFFQKSDVMFLSLKDEDIFKLTVPAKLQTYMASGKPVVAMLSGEGAELIKKSNCGYVSESGDYKNFADLILKLFRLPQEEIAQLGKNGEIYYSMHFSIHNRIKQLSRIVNS